MRTSVPARWLGRYGYVAAALALTSLVFPGGFAVPLLWIVVVSVCLARRGGPASGLQRPLAGAGLVVVVAASVAAGYGGSGSANFTKADLAGIVLKPSEGPEGLVYWKEQSGPNMLEKEGKQSAQGLKILRGLGFAGDYGSQFVAPHRSAPVQYAESFGIVLGDEEDASKALAIFKDRQRREGQRIEAIAADGLGEESWGMRGVFFPGAPPTYFYAWRVGNAMFALALAGKPDTVSEDDARALADQVDGLLPGAVLTGS